MNKNFKKNHSSFYTLLVTLLSNSQLLYFAENIIRHFRSFEYHGPPTDLTKLGIKQGLKSLPSEAIKKDSAVKSDEKSGD